MDSSYRNHRRSVRGRREKRRTDPQHHNSTGQPEHPPHGPPQAVRDRESQPHDGTSAHGEAGGLTVVCEVPRHELWLPRDRVENREGFDARDEVAEHYEDIQKRTDLARRA